MTDLWVTPQITHRLAVALRFVDIFTGRAVDDELRVRIDGHDDWAPVYGASDSTYRFTRSVEPLPNLGLVGVTVESIETPARYANRTALQITVPSAGPVPSPMTFAHHLVEHPLEPTTAFRPPNGETSLRGVVLRAGTPQPDFQLAIGVGAPPVPATAVAHTDANGEFVYRLPAAAAVVAGLVVSTTAALHIIVSDAGGAVQAVTSPPLPLIVPLGRTTSLSITVA